MVQDRLDGAGTPSSLFSCSLVFNYSIFYHINLKMTINFLFSKTIDMKVLVFQVCINSFSFPCILPLKSKNQRKIYSNGFYNVSVQFISDVNLIVFLSFFV